MLFSNGRDYTQLAGNQSSPYEPVISIMRYIVNVPGRVVRANMPLGFLVKCWSTLIKMYDLLVCNIIKMMPYNGFSQMLPILLNTEKIFYGPPW